MAPNLEAVFRVVKRTNKNSRSLDYVKGVVSRILSKL